MDILEKEWVKYEKQMAHLEQMKLKTEKATFEMGASTILGIYLSGELNKKKAQAVLQRIVKGILANHPEIE
jgi:hypothetical protein